MHFDVLCDATVASPELILSGPICVDCKSNFADRFFRNPEPYQRNGKRSASAGGWTEQIEMSLPIDCLGPDYHLSHASLPELRRLQHHLLHWSPQHSLVHCISMEVDVKRDSRFSKQQSQLLTWEHHRVVVAFCGVGPSGKKQRGSGAIAVSATKSALDALVVHLEARVRDLETSTLPCSSRACSRVVEGMAVAGRIYAQADVTAVPTSSCSLPCWSGSKLQGASQGRSSRFGVTGLQQHKLEQIAEGVTCSRAAPDFRQAWCRAMAQSQ